VSLSPSYPLQDVVDAGYAPSLRWLATEIKAGRVPGRMIGRYHRNWRMTDDDLGRFLDNACPDATEPVRDAPVASSIAAGLTTRGARRLKAVSS